MWNLFSAYLGSSSDSAQSLLDLAELETVDEVMLDQFEDIDEDTVDLVQWRHNIEPIKRSVLMAVSITFQRILKSINKYLDSLEKK